MPIRTVECLSWPAANKPGELLRFASAFESRRVNLDALWAHDSGRSGHIAAIGKNPAQLRTALRAMGVKAKASRCFYVSGRDKAGALVNALHRLSVAGINVECAEALAAQGKFSATLWVRGKDYGQAKRLLGR